MRDTTVYMLCGLPGSGKTSYANRLEESNCIRLTLDEEVFERFGRDSKPEYQAREKATKEDLLEKIKFILSEGKSVILDWGFWKKAEREKMSNFAKSPGATPKLIYFKRNRGQLLEGVKGRDLSKNHKISEALLDKFINEFEEPTKGENFLLK